MLGRPLPPSGSASLSSNIWELDLLSSFETLISEPKAMFCFFCGPTNLAAVPQSETEAKTQGSG